MSSSHCCFLTFKAKLIPFKTGVVCVSLVESGFLRAKGRFFKTVMALLFLFAVKF